MYEGMFVDGIIVLIATGEKKVLEEAHDITKQYDLHNV